MNSLHKNVLHQAITYQGRSYFTSQYFHHAYKNVNGGEKYAELKNFNKLIRSIETYQDYVDRGDIIELNQTGSKSDPALSELLIATYGKPIMLISATAQLALTHHLDDEISKRASVKVNTQAATPLTTIQVTLANCQALADLEMDLAKTKEQQKTQGDDIQKIMGLTKQLELSGANELPSGYLGIRAITSRYGRGLSTAILIDWVVPYYDVSRDTYRVFHAEGGLIEATCFHVHQFKQAVERFITTLWQVTPKFCESDILPDGKRVAFILEEKKED